MLLDIIEYIHFVFSMQIVYIAGFLVHFWQSTFFFNSCQLRTVRATCAKTYFLLRLHDRNVTHLAKVGIQSKNLV